MLNVANYREEVTIDEIAFVGSEKDRERERSDSDFNDERN